MPITVSVSLANHAEVAGQHVVQVYFTPPPSRRTRLTRYRFMLAGFAKVHVPAAARGGTAQEVHCQVPIPRTNLRHWDPKTAEHVLDGGGYSFFVCHDTRGLAAHRGGSDPTKEVEGLGEKWGPCRTHSVEI